MELVLDSITKSFGTKRVLSDASFRFEQGKIYGLLGRNGAGKTTLFNCLADEIRPDSGQALLSAEGNAHPLTPDDLGYVFSTPILPDFLTGYEFVRFMIDINQEKADPAMSPDDYFELVRIDREDRHRLIRGYSHGMKNKLQMLCFIIARPPVILLDEPLTSFDVVVALEIKALIKSMRRDHIIIFSTHILQLATDLCDEIVVLNEGKLSQVSHDMLQSPDFEAKVVEMLKDEDAHA